MNSQTECLDGVLKLHNLNCGALLDSDGVVVVRAGDFESYGGRSLVSSLLGPHGSPAHTFAAIKAPLLPQIIGQGEYFAFIDKAGANFAVVAFGRAEEKRNSAELYRQSQSVGRTIRTVFGARSEPNRVAGSD